MSIDTQIAVRIVGLGKSFGPVHPLRDVTLDLESSREVHVHLAGVRRRRPRRGLWRVGRDHQPA
jgi:hypothetical protein